LLAPSFGAFALTAAGVALETPGCPPSSGGSATAGDQAEHAARVRRLAADPWFGSRTYAVLLISLIFGAFVAYVPAFCVQHSNDTLEWLINAGMVVLIAICAGASSSS